MGEAAKGGKLEMAFDRFFKTALLVVLTGFLLLGWWAAKRADRFQYSTEGEVVTVFDKQTGTVYFLAKGVWREVHPQTGQAIDRAFWKVN